MRRGEMRHLAIGMNLAADFEQTELVEVARVVVDVLPDARQQAGAQQVLIAGDGVRDLHVGRVEPKARAIFFADEGVVVDLGEALRRGHFADAVMELALGIRGRHARGRERRDGRDGIVADHAADFFHQIVLDGDVLGGAPARHEHGEDSRRDFLDPEFERFENAADFGGGNRSAELAIEPIERQRDRWRRGQRAISVGEAADQADAGRDFLAAVPGRAASRGWCSPGPALFRSAWRRRCGASAATKSCGRWRR